MLVRLNGADGVGNIVVDSVLTDSTGMYMFGDLIPGHYTVSMVMPDGYLPIPSDSGSNDSLDSDADEFGILPTEHLISGEDNPTYDAGIFQPAKIGDFVWLDSNANGIQEAGEVGLENVTMLLNGVDNGRIWLLTNETGQR